MVRLLAIALVLTAVVLVGCSSNAASTPTPVLPAAPPIVQAPVLSSQEAVAACFDQYWPALSDESAAVQQSSGTFGQLTANLRNTAAATALSMTATRIRSDDVRVQAVVCDGRVSDILWPIQAASTAYADGYTLMDTAIQQQNTAVASQALQRIRDGNAFIKTAGSHSVGR